MKFKEKLIATVSPVKKLDAELQKVTSDMIKNSVHLGSKWLDLGCGQKPFIDDFNICSYIGIDVEVSGRDSCLKSPDLFFDGKTIPFPGNSFDGILCTQVLEHVVDLELTLTECSRVLKPGGCMIVSVPFLYREHEQPFDFRRFTSFGIYSLFERNGFKVERAVKGLGSISTITMLANSYIAINISSRGRLLFVFGGLLIAANFGIAKILSKLLPDNGEIFSVLVVRAIKLEVDTNGS